MAGFSGPQGGVIIRDFLPELDPGTGLPEAMGLGRHNGAPYVRLGAAVILLVDNVLVGRWAASAGMPMSLVNARVRDVVVWAGLSGLLTLLLSRSAEWFGVPVRGRWRTAWREGWWAWLLAGVQGLVLPLVAWMFIHYVR